MRLISFSMTLESFRDGTKDVTRRIGWKNLRAGDRLMAVEKAQGLKKGERVKRLGMIEVVSVRREKIGDVDREDVRREGFGDMKPLEFVRRFLEAHQSTNVSLEVTRIEFLPIRCTPPDRHCAMARGHDGDHSSSGPFRRQSSDRTLHPRGLTSIDKTAGIERGPDGLPVRLWL